MATQGPGHVATIYGAPLYVMGTWTGTMQHALALGMDTSRLVPYVDTMGPFVGTVPDWGACPLLKASLASRIIQLDGRQYVGFGSDGIRVYLGTVGDESDLEAYLVNYPTPSHW